ncbi:hypothetical protein [Bacillus cereus group sp. IBL03679]|uniref:hypothetical protein n=1 Tax=Bacillus cereus group sp. IBL03679 TaxID=3240095 RepID=UPI003D2F7FE2
MKPVLIFHFFHFKSVCSAKEEQIWKSIWKDADEIESAFLMGRREKDWGIMNESNGS